MFERDEKFADGFEGLPLGERLRDAGIAQVLERLTEKERNQIAAEVLKQHVGFGPDQVRQFLPASIIVKLDAFPNAMGGVFQTLARKGFIEKTGRRIHSPRPERRNGDSAEWMVTPAGLEHLAYFAGILPTSRP